jgi:hypothetical protein
VLRILIIITKRDVERKKSHVRDLLITTHKLDI